MTLDKNIALVKNILDVTLDLQISYIKDLNNNINLNLQDNVDIQNDYIDYFISLLNSMNIDRVYSILNNTYGNYTAICIDEKNKDYILIGPYTYDSNEYEMFSIYNSYIPIISKHKLRSIISTITKFVLQKDFDLELIEIKESNKSKITESESINESMLFINSETLNYNASNEYKLLFCVRNGNHISASKFLDRLFSINSKENSDSKLREVKNTLIYFNTLFKKAIEIEHVPLAQVYNIFYKYLEKIESLSSVNESKDLISSMILKYCNLVSNYKLKNCSFNVRKSINYINAHLDDDLSVTKLADLLFISPSYLSKLFKKELDCSVIEYINNERIKLSKYLLKNTNLPIRDVCLSVGINDLNYFSRLFKKYVKKTPSQYRKERSFIDVAICK